MITVETFTKSNLPAKVYIVYTSLGYRIMCEDKEGLSEWPIDYSQWGNTTGIAYNNPERLPQYAKALVHKAYKRLKLAYPFCAYYGV